MKKNLILTSLAIILMTMTIWESAAQAAVLPASTNRTPAIQDPLLLEAWTRLNEAHEPIRLWDGRTLSGHDLAQFVADQAIPVIWNTKNICNGFSCSIPYSHGDLTTYDDGLPGVEPIYITLSVMNLGEKRMTRIVETMTHEIVHRMQLYGQVRDSLYEEYTAYYISAQMNGTSPDKFERYNPLMQSCLKGWFTDHNLLYGYYLDIEAYPQSMIALADVTTPTCGTSAE